MTVTVDCAVPDCSAPMTGGKTFSLKALRGQPVLLYFYPKDHTPGCTTEASNFRDRYNAFQELGVAIFGVSRDNLRSHENFKAKLELPFELIADVDETVCDVFDVIKMKKLYGKEYRGVERSTFLIDSDGMLRQEWRGLRVANHVNEALDAVETLQSSVLISSATT